MFDVELSGFVVELSGLVVELSGFVVELSGFVELLFLSSFSLGVVCVVSSEGSVDSEGGEVSTPAKNNATDNMIATIALIFFFCKNVSIKGKGNIKKAAQSKNKLEKWKPFTNANIAKNPPTIHLTIADLLLGDLLLGFPFGALFISGVIVGLSSFLSFCLWILICVLNSLGSLFF